MSDDCHGDYETWLIRYIGYFLWAQEIANVSFLMVVGIRLWHILLGNDRDIRIFQMILSLDVKVGMAE